MWLPDVMTSTPEARIASAVDGVRPIPPATFSPLAVTKSMPRCSRSSASSPSTATRPGLPIRSPIISTRHAPRGRGASPLGGLPRRVRPVVGFARSVRHGRIVAGRRDQTGRCVARIFPRPARCPTGPHIEWLRPWVRLSLWGGRARFARAPGSELEADLTRRGRAFGSAEWPDHRSDDRPVDGAELSSDSNGTLRGASTKLAPHTLGPSPGLADYGMWYERAERGPGPPR